MILSMNKRACFIVAKKISTMTAGAITLVFKLVLFEISLEVVYETDIIM